MHEGNLAELTFEQAADIWWNSRQRYLKEKTVDMYRQYIKKGLSPFFGGMVLKNIHIGHIREYQVWRGTPREQDIRLRNNKVHRRITQANASCINHELNCLSQILQRAGLWVHLKDFYDPMPLPKWIPPRVLSSEEEDRLFRVAASNPEWLVAYLATSITANTTASGCELRGLRLKDIDMRNGVLYIPSDSVKNEFRARVIPMNERAKLQIERLMIRAADLGSARPDDYLIPFRLKRGSYDPTQPTKGWRSAFREIRVAAGLPWLRPHDLRHHAITKLLERPEISEETVKAIAGHISPRILAHYSHIRIEAKRTALNAITPKPPLPSRGLAVAGLGRKSS